MHTILVIILILTICLCDVYSLCKLHFFTLLIILLISSRHTCQQLQRKNKGKLISLYYCLFVMFLLIRHCTCWKHQRESIPTPHQFSTIHIFCVKIFDSSHGFSANQKHTKIKILTQATPTIDNGFARSFFLKLCRTLFAWFSYFVRGVRLFWGMVVRGFAR